ECSPASVTAPLASHSRLSSPRPSSFFFDFSGDHPALPSFPTRRSSDSCAHAAAGQGPNQDASAGPAADPQQVVLLVAMANFAGREGVNGVVLPVHIERLQREQQSGTSLDASRFFGLHHNSLGASAFG